MKLRLSEPGALVSAGAHLFALLLLVVTFTKPEKFDSMQETVPIETVSDSEFNEVMKGDKSAKEVHPDAPPKIEQTQVTPAPQPPTPEAQKPPPPPPPPLPPVEPVKETPPPPPQPPVEEAKPAPEPPTPPTRPAPSVPTPPERVDADAEPLAAKPVPTPPRPPERVVEAKPVPPVRPKPAPKPPKVEPRPKPDQLAKLLDTPQPDAPPAKAQPRPKAPETPPTENHTFDLTDISRLLTGQTAPAQKAAPAHEQGKLASLGSPTAHSAKMAPSLWGQLDGLMEEQYRQCWSYLGLSAGQKYIPQIRVSYDESGGLEADPVLVNPPSDPGLRSLAESAMRAVRRCNPLRIPAQYAPYYDEWRGRVLRFDPEEMAG